MYPWYIHHLKDLHAPFLARANHNFIQDHANLSVREKENVPQFVSRLEGRFFFCNADIPIFIHTFAHVCAYIYTYRPFQPCLYSELRELISLYKRMCLNINPNFKGTFTWKGDVFISMYIYACVCVCTYTHTFLYNPVSPREWLEHGCVDRLRIECEWCVNSVRTQRENRGGARTIHIKYKWFIHDGVMSHIEDSCHTWMSHCTYKWVMSPMNESSYMWRSHVTYEPVMSHMNESRHMWMRYVCRL